MPFQGPAFVMCTFLFPDLALESIEVEEKPEAEMRRQKERTKKENLLAVGFYT